MAERQTRSSNIPIDAPNFEFVDQENIKVWRQLRNPFAAAEAAQVDGALYRLLADAIVTSIFHFTRGKVRFRGVVSAGDGPGDPPSADVQDFALVLTFMGLTNHIKEWSQKNLDGVKKRMETAFVACSQTGLHKDPLQLISAFNLAALQKAFLLVSNRVDRTSIITAMRELMDGQSNMLVSSVASQVLLVLEWGGMSSIKFMNSMILAGTSMVFQIPSVVEQAVKFKRIFSELEEKHGPQLPYLRTTSEGELKPLDLTNFPDLYEATISFYKKKRGLSANNYLTSTHETVCDKDLIIRAVNKSVRRGFKMTEGMREGLEELGMNPDDFESGRRGRRRRGRQEDPSSESSSSEDSESEMDTTSSKTRKRKRTRSSKSR